MKPENDINGNGLTDGEDQTPALDLKEMTLNGYTVADAGTMRTNFKKTNLDTPKHGFVFFSKAVLGNITDLLNKEVINGAGPAKDIKPDGIRIYFACTADDGTGVNTVLVVSTSDNGEDLNAPSQRKHKDYFWHDTGHALYTLASAPGKDNLYGDPGNDSAPKSAATLYDPSYQCPNNDNCNTKDPHYISCSKAKAMVTAFTSGGPIKTSAIWFSLAYLNDLSSENKHDGVRLYFARETDGDKMETFVIVTTELTADGTQADYHDCRGNRRVAPPLQTKTSDQESITAEAHGPVITTILGDGENGENCPHHCDCTSPLADPDDCTPPPLAAVAK